MAVILALLALIGAASAAPVAVEDIPRLSLSHDVEWCVSEADVAAVAAGACRFAPASADDLIRGFTAETVWLRLTLVNPYPYEVDRWLQIGHPRLTHVTFFERLGAGWQRHEAGMAVPVARRQVMEVDPLLAFSLAPHERRLILVRISSLATIDIKPVLWQSTAYTRERQKRDFFDGIGIGGLLACALVILALSHIWDMRAYINLCVFVFSIVLLSTSYSGLLQFYLWPADWPFDLRVQVVAGTAWVVSFVLFVFNFLDRERFRYFRGALLAMTAFSLAAMVWTCFIDYRVGVHLLLIIALFTVATATLLLLWLSWKGGFTKIGFLLAVICVYVFIRSVTIAFGVTHKVSGDALSISNIWQFLLACLPAALIGILADKQRMQRLLLLSQAESAARVNFLARMSHELRTPLDIIIGTAQLLARPSHRARFKEGLADISANGRQLLKMIDEVLDYSRGLVGKLSIAPEAVNWPEFLRALEHNAQVLAARNGNLAKLNVTGDALEAVRVDERRLKQILDNLLSNAARHTKQGWIRIDCIVGAERENRRRFLEFAVIDSGDGIPPGDVERIFEPFERGGNSVQHGGKGVGIGLAISRQLVELMGGKLTVESEPGKGACFRFRVIGEHADVADTKDPLLERISDYAGPRRCILIADDEADNRAILADLLRDSGFSVIEADCGRAAVARCGDADAVLTDQFMADGDGWYVLREVAARQPGIPVVLVSAAPPERPVNMPPDLDFDAHLLKPLNHSEVLRCLGELLDLEWIEAPVEMPVKPATIECPGEGSLAALRAMIDGGRVSEIVAWAEEHEARCPRLAAEVSAAARDLDFAALAEMASRSSSQSGE